MPTNKTSFGQRMCLASFRLFYLSKFVFSAINNNRMPSDQIFALHTNNHSQNNERKNKFFAIDSFANIRHRNDLCKMESYIAHRKAMCKSILIGAIYWFWTSKFYCDDKCDNFQSVILMNMIPIDDTNDGNCFHAITQMERIEEKNKQLNKA